MKQVTVFFLACVLASLSFNSLQAQVYEDYFGTGNNQGISISSSPSQGADSADKTLNGTGFFPDMEGASRFLAQAGFGGTYEELQYVTQVGIEAWLDEQMVMVPNPYLTNYQATYADVENRILAVHPGEEVDRNRTYMDFVFFEKVLKDNDVLRNKAAFALHQIFVLSTLSNRLNDAGYGMADYYDILYEGAFGNFRDMLKEVTLHPLMGVYLSHFKNRKADPSIGSLPDENYAREVMQLFTIGLYELNNDGSHKLDANGESIPTYDIEDIQELAKIFTGLSGGAYNLVDYPNLAGQPLSFNSSANVLDPTVPMMMFEGEHEPGPKVMIDGSVIPSGQSGMQDIEDALDVLFNHPNVGPFIAIRLIQQLVKSNPSPAYINRVALVFNNNGQGVRGDMKAVFKAILMDSEARDCDRIENDAKTGKLKQPLERFLSLFRTFDIDSPSGDLWFGDAAILINVIEQTFMGAPTVFNYFTPFYAEDEYVAPNGLVSPEFQILHSVTAIHYLNLMENVITIQPFQNYTRVNPNNPRMQNNNADAPFLDFTDEIALYGSSGINALLDRLDVLLCHGQLSANTRTIIADAITDLESNDSSFSDVDAVKTAIYFMVISSDYTILK